MVIFSFIIIKFNNLILIFLIIFLRITKSAQFPFITWLPAAIAAPTPVSALVHSSTLVTAGVFILFYFKNYFILINLKLIFFIRILTLFFAGIRAILENDFKKIVAFSTLSQVAFLFIIISCIKFFLCFFHLFTHAFFKRILFVCVGGVLHSSNRRQESRRYLKNKLNNKFSLILINLSILNLLGLFFLRGFWRKDLFLINNIIFLNIFNIKILILISISLTYFYSFKILYFIYNWNIIFKTENSFNLNTSLLGLFFFSLFLGVLYFENYLYFFENYLYFFENYLYILFLSLFFIIFNYFILFKNNYFFSKIIGLRNLNWFFIIIFNNIFNKIEKINLDKIFFINYFIFKNFNNFLLIFIIIFLILL